MATINYVNTGPPSSGNPINLNFPAGLVNGNYLIAFVHTLNSGSANDFPVPAGWTPLTPYISAGINGLHAIRVFCRLIDGTQGTSQVFTQTANVNSTFWGQCIQVTAFSPAAVTYAVATDSPASTNHNAPSVTIKSTNDLLVTYYITENTPNFNAAPSGMTQAFQSNSWFNCLDWQNGIAAGLSGAKNQTSATAVIATDLSLTLSSISTITISRTFKWNVLQQASLSRIFKWNTKGKITTTRILLWNTRETISTSRIFKWNTRVTVAIISRTFKWNVAKQVLVSRIFLWNTGARVQIDRVLLWNTRTVVPTVSRVFKWKTRVSVPTVSRIFKWKVRQSIEVTRVFKWDTYKGIIVSRTFLWNVAGRIATTRTFLWNVFRGWQEQDNVNTDWTELESVPDVWTELERANTGWR